MRFKSYENLLLLLAIACLAGLPSCGRDQQLTSITIQPSMETFGASNIPVPLDAGLTVQLRALGNFIHPPVTKDITSQVTWSSNTPGVASVSNSGLVTATGEDCGGTLVSATVNKNSSDGGISSGGAVVTGYIMVNVTCFTGTGPTLTIDFAGTGAGTVTSSPVGLTCTATCTASFTSGSTITLTATAGGTFGGWSGCDVMSGQTCTVDNLTANRAVTATFD